MHGDDFDYCFGVIPMMFSRPPCIPAIFLSLLIIGCGSNKMSEKTQRGPEIGEKVYTNPSSPCVCEMFFKGWKYLLSEEETKEVEEFFDKLKKKLKVYPGYPQDTCIYYFAFYSPKDPPKDSEQGKKYIKGIEIFPIGYIYFSGSSNSFILDQKTWDDMCVFMEGLEAKHPRKEADR